MCVINGFTRSVIEGVDNVDWFANPIAVVQSHYILKMLAYQVGPNISTVIIPKFKLGIAWLRCSHFYWGFLSLTIGATGIKLQVVNSWTGNDFLVAKCSSLCF